MNDEIMAGETADILNEGNRPEPNGAPENALDSVWAEIAGSPAVTDAENAGEQELPAVTGTAMATGTPSIDGDGAPSTVAEIESSLVDWATPALDEPPLPTMADAVTTADETAAEPVTQAPPPKSAQQRQKRSATRTESKPGGKKSSAKRKTDVSADTPKAEPAAPPAKRNPGRPRKVVAAALATDAAVTDAAEPAAPLAKRKPGRPRKVVAAALATDAAVTDAAEPAAPPAKRKPGRPRKVVAAALATDAAITEAAEPAAPPAKRKPGRPRKVVTVAPVTDAAVTEAAEPAAPPAKRKPGRPRKVVAVAPVTDAAVTEAAEPAAPPAKRKPGRPRKVVAVDGVAVDPAPGAPETSQTVSMAEYESDTDHGDDNGNYWMSDGTADVTDSSPGSQTSAPASGRFSYAEIIRQLKLDHTLPPNRSFQPLTTIPATLSPEDLISSDDVYNRELSWLDFNWRVLHEALDPRTPLLERLKFIAITSSNLDEFFSKRVGGLKRMRAAGVANLTLDGWAPDVQLQLISKAVQQMVETESACLHEDILPALAQHGVRIVSYDELDSAQKERLKAYYLKEVYPILTPLAVDPGHPFPFISHLSLSLAVLLRDTSSGDVQFARVKVPQTRPRWVPIDFPLHFVPLEQIITANLDSLFKGMEVVAVYPFRVTRNADIARNEEEADDLLEMINEELRERRFAPVVRLEVDASIPPEWLALLQGQLHLDNTDTYPIRGLMRRVDLFALADINLPHLKYEPWTPFTPPKFSGLSSKARPSEIFSVIRQGDLLVHHPYQSFQSSTQLFIESAARDPQVLAIKQTLYRTSEQSAVIAALIQAAERGKQVAALVEVKARFDEAKNIEWARKLEDAGCHVTYGLVGLKTHCKVSLAIRQEEDGLRAYYHIGTGNYNAKTAAVYTDFGFFSCNPEIAADLMDLFNHLTGYSYQTDYRKLLVAPVNMRQRFGQLIDQEISHALAGKRARIIAKMNGLDDPFLVRKLYEASQAGVSIDLIVRGNCRIRPGIPGISDNIRLTSVIGRNLEHHRIFYFENDGTPHFSIGSADWMRRNLSSRVEAAVPIEDPRLQEYLLMVLHNSLQDHRHAWEMLPDGRYRQRQPGVGATALEAGGVQNYLMQHTRLSSSPTLAP